jgi:hypothetical protein
MSKKMNLHPKNKVISQEHFSIRDFHERWKRARMSALKSFLQISRQESSSKNETDLLSLIAVEIRSQALRIVFDNSRKLGASASRFLGLSWEVQDISDVLSQSESPCLKGYWENTKTGKTLKRKGCDQLQTVGSYVCDYWREALDGLIMGVGETERYARHASMGHGDIECTDVFYDDSLDVNGDINGKQQKFGEVPKKVFDGLTSLTAFLLKQEISLNLRGISENVLYYELISNEKPICGSSNRFIEGILVKEVKTQFAGLDLKDASPLAVYGEGT